jgi:hypothetical protein
MCKLVVLQIHVIGDVLEVNHIIQMVVEPQHQHLTNGKGQMLSWVMSAFEELEKMCTWHTSPKLTF